MAAEQKAVNLAGEPRVVLTTGSNRWNQGLDSWWKATQRGQRRGEAARTGRSVAQQYQGDWDFAAKDGMFHHEDGGSAVVFEVTPTKVLAFAKGHFGQTRYRFPTAHH